MLIEAIKSEGLAHISYLICDGIQAAVVDPRRDCEIYVEKAAQQGARITHIFETHRNEDYAIGSVPLARLTGAKIYHGAELPFHYGNTVTDKDHFMVGRLRLEVIKTPGHTFESISVALADTDFSADPVAVFTGDALFIGDVGRTDFFPGREQETAENLYHSIFSKLLPLGDDVNIYPAHGAGSVCGAGLADREFSTLGFERKHNPMLQKSREEFIKYKMGERHYKPPYFSRMEKFNLEGPPPTAPAQPQPCSVKQLEQAMTDGAQVIDLRSPEAYAGAHIPGSIALPLDMIPAYAGWFLDYDRDIVLVNDDFAQVGAAVRYLYRIGYEKVTGFLAGGILAWEVSGHAYETIPDLFAGDLTERLKNAPASFTLLDVRSRDEFEEGHLPGAVHAYLGFLPAELKKLPAKLPAVTFCGSGRRAIIAASVLRNNGFKSVENCFGSMMACAALGATVVRN